MLPSFCLQWSTFVSFSPPGMYSKLLDGSGLSPAGFVFRFILNLINMFSWQRPAVQIITREIKVGRAAPEVLPRDEKGDREILPGGDPSHRAHYRDSLGLQNQNDVSNNHDMFLSCKLILTIEVTLSGMIKNTWPSENIKKDPIWDGGGTALWSNSYQHN